jgi:rare lipoprotein A
MLRIPFLWTIQLAAVLVVAQSQSVVAAEKTSGKATIYSGSFNGKKTASGSTYNHHAVSVASNRLPLGSKVLVKNKKNDKAVVARVTDRMAKHSAAAVDLSKGAANKLGVKGTGQVEATVVAKDGAKK